MVNRFDNTKSWYEQLRKGEGFGSPITMPNSQKYKDSSMDMFKPHIPKWLKKCKKCKSYSSVDVKTTRHKYGRVHNHITRRFNCSNPKGNIFKQANCFELNPHWDSIKTKLKRIRTARFPTATVEKMRRTKEVKAMVAIEVTKALELDEGMHKGEICDIQYREMEYKGEQINYTDVFIVVDGTSNLKIKYGCPTHISDKSKLGKLLMLFTTLPKAGKKIDPNKILIGKRVQFQTTNDVTDRGTFARVIGDTIKPCK